MRKRSDRSVRYTLKSERFWRFMAVARGSLKPGSIEAP
jgi:hypothetical protein